MAKEWYFCTPYCAFVCIETETINTSTFHDCLQVCLMVSEVTTIGDDVISDASYFGETLVSSTFV